MTSDQLKKLLEKSVISTEKETGRTFFTFSLLERKINVDINVTNLSREEMIEEILASDECLVTLTKAYRKEYLKELLCTSDIIINIVPSNTLNNF